ncbi:hypothetical protein CMU38_10990 [Elizabethkingia anophelis]|nr:hypothetical protein [Elizabethkingia anophelis]
MKKIEYPLTKEQDQKFNTLFENFEFYNNSNDELRFFLSLYILKILKEIVKLNSHICSIKNKLIKFKNI